MARPTISFVIPCFNEEAVLFELERRLRTLTDSTGDTWEVVFIDDGSTDRTLHILEDLSRSEPRYRVVSLTRNFGHQLALTAGLDHARGDAVVVMDADLQDPPEVVREMLTRWREGYDVVYGVRDDRAGESLFKRATAAIFYRTLRFMVGLDIPIDTGDFRLMSRRVVLALRALQEVHRFVRGMVVWLGFKQIAVHYRRAGRFAGSTKYPLGKMLRFALDGITSFSVTPLRISSFLGFVTGLGAFLLGAWALYARFYANATVPGWTSTVVMVAFFSSIQLVMIGVLGEYVGRIYEQTKGRPLYIVGSRTNCTPDDAGEAETAQAMQTEKKDG